MKRFKNILFVASGTNADKLSFARAVALARKNQAHLTLIAVVNAIPRTYGKLTSEMPADRVETLRALITDEKREYLEQLISGETTNELRISIEVLTGIRFIEIIRQVVTQGHDLVIKAASGEASTLAQLFGSTDLHLLRKCPCPVWIIKPGQRKHYSRILAAVDVEPGAPEEASLNQLVLDLATSLARLEGCELHLVHVWEFYAEAKLRSRTIIPASEIDKMVRETEGNHKRWLNELLTNYDLSGLTIKPHIVKGDPRVVIPDVAHKKSIELIVMGTVARTGLPGLFIGNTAEAVLNQVNCSVLAVKPEGFVSPVEARR